MLKLFSWFGQMISSPDEGQESGSTGTTTGDPCHLFTDALDEKAEQLDQLVEDIDALLDQLYHCRTGTLASASWLAQPNESEEYRQHRIGAAAVQQTIRQLRNAATMVKTTAITLRQPQQAATE